MLTKCGTLQGFSLNFSLRYLISFVNCFLFAGKDGRTQFLEEHNVLRSMRNGFCIFDSRGLEYDQPNEGLEEVSEWMEEGVRHCQLCRGSGKIKASASSSSAATKRFVRRRVNCVMVVISISEIYRSFMRGDFRPLQVTRELFHAPSITSTCSKSNSIPRLHLRSYSFMWGFSGRYLDWLRIAW